MELFVTSTSFSRKLSRGFRLSSSRTVANHQSTGASRETALKPPVATCEQTKQNLSAPYTNSRARTRSLAIQNARGRDDYYLFFLPLKSLIIGIQPGEIRKRRKMRRTTGFSTFTSYSRRKRLLPPLRCSLSKVSYGVTILIFHPRVSNAPSKLQHHFYETSMEIRNRIFS